MEDMQISTQLTVKSSPQAGSCWNSHRPRHCLKTSSQKTSHLLGSQISKVYSVERA